MAYTKMFGQSFDNSKQSLLVGGVWLINYYEKATPQITIYLASQFDQLQSAINKVL